MQIESEDGPHGLAVSAMRKTATLLLEVCQKNRESGQKEYARNNSDTHSNFKRLAIKLGDTPAKILSVYQEKHIEGITSHFEGQISQREPLAGRVSDAIVYLYLLATMPPIARQVVTPPTVSERMENALRAIAAEPIARGNAQRFNNLVLGHADWAYANDSAGLCGNKIEDCAAKAVFAALAEGLRLVRRAQHICQLSNDGDTPDTEIVASDIDQQMVDDVALLLVFLLTLASAQKLVEDVERKALTAELWLLPWCEPFLVDAAKARRFR